MKIGITCYPTFGGSGVVATELGIALAARGDEVHFISYALPSRPASRAIRFHQVIGTDVPPSSRRPTRWRSPRMAEVAGQVPDLLHVHYALPHAVSTWRARWATAAGAAGRHDAPADVTIVGQDRSYLRSRGGRSTRATP